MSKSTAGVKSSQEPATGPEPSLVSFHEEYMSQVFQGAQEKVMHKADEPELTIEPDSSGGTLASFKNLETFGDQFMVDKPTETELDKSGDEHGEAISMVDVSVRQAISTIPTSTI